MRNIKDYENKYQTEPCEKYQVKYRREKIIELLSQYKHDNVVEIGCGMEPLCEFFTDFQQMIVVEPGEIFSSNLNLKAEKAKKDIICIKGFFEDNVEYIKEINHEIDFVIVSSLLHEVENPEKLLHSVRDLCTDNTIVHINVPNANSIHRLLAKEMGIIEDVYELSNLQKSMQRNWVFDMESLSRIVESCGFEILQKGSYFPKFLSADQMERMLESSIIEENIFEGLNRLIKYIPEFGSEIFVQLKKKVYSGNMI